MCRWAFETFRWPEFDFSPAASVFRWPDFDFSHLSWNSESLRWLGLVIVDDVLWSMVTVLESLALVAMLCFFFVFCGCTL
ncbi:uncharacterized protein LOC131152013 [Malania oleifera]|uniref:uncharacterized protein LOC131152013 n=1 Tax=Malania oleifera TaxID=397392 RepID=UPI0025ADEF26|nr:uncharacterized protein LOC131152013 [Malania oleifera]